ncbi:hypothetical protein GW17_00024783 [Ensete ventricosum]|nr:hypothetical protein GW17_00024783 [Ensete ventricosum]
MAIPVQTMLPTFRILASFALPSSSLDAPSTALHYHNGSLLSSPINIYTIWYGSFTAAVSDFFASFRSSHSQQPTVQPGEKLRGERLVAPRRLRRLYGPYILRRDRRAPASARGRTMPQHMGRHWRRTVIAGAVTNPFRDGYYQGDWLAPLEATTACAGIFGKGAYPGNPGNLLIDEKSEASFNAFGAGGRRFLLPAVWEPISGKCKVVA